MQLSKGHPLVKTLLAECRVSGVDTSNLVKFLRKPKNDNDKRFDKSLENNIDRYIVIFTQYKQHSITKEIL